MNQSLIRKLENSWIFWTIFVVGVIATLSAILGKSINTILPGYIFFPLGLLYFIPNSSQFIHGALSYIYDLIYYSVLGLIVVNIVKDKRFNTKLILLLLFILIITFIGCIQMKIGY